MIIFGNFLLTASLIGLTIFIANRYGNHEPKQTTTTAEAQIANMTFVSYVEGGAEYYLNGTWVPLSTGYQLQESDTVRTLEDGRLIISIADGSTIRLGAKTTVEIGELSQSGIIIINSQGRLYARVAPDSNRTFAVRVGETMYTAMGTAFETLNTETEQGVRVYESTVRTDENQLITQGQQYYTANQDPKLTATVSSLDLAELQNDPFVLWNKQQDEADPAYSKRLGLLVKLTTNGAPTSTTNTTTTTPIASTGGQGIALYGSSTDDGISLTWTTNALDTKDGFKVVYSSSDGTPSYKGANTVYEFASSNASSAFASLTDGKTWHFRVCAYRTNDTCVSYSNVFAITAPLKTKARVVHGSMSAQIQANTLSWDYSGSAVYGYKINWNTSGNPTYPASTDAKQAGNQYIASASTRTANLSELITKPGLYYINICAYTDGTEATACVNYSNIVTYIAI